jgi:hypothetical protein
VLRELTEIPRHPCRSHDPFELFEPALSRVHIPSSLRLSNSRIRPRNTPTRRRMMR